MFAVTIHYLWPAIQSILTFMFLFPGFLKNSCPEGGELELRLSSASKGSVCNKAQ